MTSADWSGDWRNRVVDRVKERGFASISAYGDARNGLTFHELARELGPDVAPIQIGMLMREEADGMGGLSRLAQTSLVRYLRQYLPAGWSSQKEAEFPAASAFADWIALLGSDFRAKAERLWEIFRSANDIPRGWLPRDRDDDLYRRLWDRAGL